MYIFQWTECTWTKTQEIVPDGSSAMEMPRFGTAVALSGDVLVVGAPEASYQVHIGGEVRVYERIGNTWKPVARFRLPPIPETLGHQYYALGGSVAVCGNTIVAGAYGNFGAAYVYQRGADGWSRDSIIENPSPEVGDGFGRSVDVEPGTIVVGRPHYSSVDPRVGRAFVYEQGVSGSWNLSREFRASDGYADGDGGDFFGESVALVRDRIVVGASRGRFSGFDTGTVYLFERTASDWPATENMRLVASDSSGALDRVGGAVDMHETFIISGAIGGWYEGLREGKAYAFNVELGDACCDPGDSGGTLRATGSEIVKDEHLILTVRNTPANVRGLFLFSPRPGSYPFGTATLCLGAPVSRLGFVLTGPEGVAMYDIDFGAPWLDELIAGSTW